MKKFFSVIFVVLFFFSIITPVWAEEENDSETQDIPTPVETIIDLLVLRPMGLAATALSASIFVLTLPFTLPTKSDKIAKEALIKKPYEFTFKRPLGRP